jgi:uncharacterized membrane protein YphA (DoxX/SURF4 family)
MLVPPTISQYVDIATIAGRTVLATVLLVAGIAKLIEGRALIGVVREYKLLPDPAAVLVGYCLPWLEVGLGLALIAGIAVLPSTMAALNGLAPFLAAALFLSFGGAVGINIARGRRDIDCGCFGSRGSRLTWWLVGRNVTLAASSALITALAGPTTPLARPDAILTVVLTASSIGLGVLLVRTVDLWQLVDINQPSTRHIEHTKDDVFPVIAKLESSRRHVH